MIFSIEELLLSRLMAPSTGLRFLLIGQIRLNASMKDEPPANGPGVKGGRGTTHLGDTVLELRAFWAGDGCGPWRDSAGRRCQTRRRSRPTAVTHSLPSFERLEGNIDHRQIRRARASEEGGVDADTETASGKVQLRGKTEQRTPSCRLNLHGVWPWRRKEAGRGAVHDDEHLLDEPDDDNI